jgi:transposase-like protein
MIERLRPKSATAVVPTVGAPTKYDPKTYPRIAKLLAQRGAILSEIADCFGVTTRTLSNWLNEYPEFREAVDAGNDVFNSRVERALAERAIGYSVDTEEIKVINGKIVHVPVRQYYPPNVTAIIFFLKNRQPEKWRDVQRHEVNATGLKSSDELRQLLALEFKDLIDQGLLALPAPRKMKEIKPKRYGTD